MLREYQKEAIELIENSNSKNIMLQMPTGSGKTFTFCEAAKRHFAEKITKVLIIVHRTELLEQAFNSLGERCFKIEAGVKQIPSDYDYYVGMVETINKRLKLLPHFGLVIIDEAHIGNFKKLPFFADNNTDIIGVTATPIAEYPLSIYYSELMQPVTIEKLINNKFLLDCDAYGFASDLVGKQKWKTKMGEFDEKQMEDFYSSEKMVKNVIESYWKLSAGKKTLIFNVNVKHNEAVYNAFKKEGLNVYQLTGETSKIERKETIELFKRQEDAIICNVGVLTTGFDEPTVKTIILNRATKSLSLYLQMIGRGSRIYENKEKFTVIDLGKNTLRHGHYSDYIDWETYFRNGTKKESKGESAMPIKECPECNFMQHTRKVVCVNCGHNFEEEAAKQKKEEKEQQLYLLIKNKPIMIPTEKLFDMAKERDWKPYAILHKISDHIINYENKHKNIVTEDYSASLGLIELEKWCKKYDKKNNQWHKDLMIKFINEKRIENTTGNSDVC